MNAEQLNAIAYAIHEDLKNSRLSKRLGTLISAIRDQINSPAPQNIERIVTSKNELETAIDESMFVRLPPTWAPLVKSLNLGYLQGDNIVQLLDSIAENNQINLNQILTQLEDIQNRLNEDSAKLEGLLSAFEHFGIEWTALEPGEAELYVEIPGELFDFELGDFSKELKELDFILRTFSEVALDEPPKSPTIRQISSSDPTLYLALAPGAILFTLKCLNMILDAYKRVVEIRNLSLNAKEAGLSPATLESIESEAKEVVDREVKKFLAEVAKSYLKKEREGQRQKELTHCLERALRMFAARVDHGYRIEARIEPLPEREEEEDSGKGEEQIDKKLAEQIREIERLAGEVAYFRPQGEPILQLPVTDAAVEGDEQSEPPKERTTRSK